MFFSASDQFTQNIHINIIVFIQTHHTTLYISQTVVICHENLFNFLALAHR